jgi:hypothetical protein
MRNTALALTCALALTASANAASMSLDDLQPGKTVNGPELSVKDMKGKVVFVIYWGTH